ncbi:MAG: hypothetical protein WA970_18365 [Gammaproteobacteria bacterium]
MQEDDEERQQGEKICAAQEIYRLSTAERIKMALNGSREARSILIRDPNRDVAHAVLSSPRVCDAEIEAISSMRGASSAVLRVIGRDRDWPKRYGVRLNLACNPRTPLEVAIGLVSGLKKQDLRRLARDRNLPEQVRSEALKLLREDDGGEAAEAPVPKAPRGPESIPPASGAAELRDED